MFTRRVLHDGRQRKRFVLPASGCGGTNRIWPTGDKGAVAILFALCGSMMITAMCVALDSVVESMIISRAQAASDVATLSIGNDTTHFATITGSDLTQLQADALNYYNANMTGADNDLKVSAANFTANIASTSSSTVTIALTVNGTYTLPFALPLTSTSSTSTTGSATTGTSTSGAGTTTSTGTSTTSSGTVSSVSITVNSTATITPSKNLELVMVFDNTGSMADQVKSSASTSKKTVYISKLDGLKAAANILLDDVMNNGGGTTYVGLVPFATTVNVKGALSPTGSWLNPVFTYNSTNVSMSNWSGCTAEPREASTGYLYPLAYSPLSSSKFTPYYFNVPPAGMIVTTYNKQTSTTSKGKTTTTGGLCSTPVASTTTIKGVPVSTKAGYVNYCAYTGNAQYNGIAYNFDVSPTSSGSTQSATQNSDCVTDAVTFLTTDQDTLTNGIAAMNASGSTIIPTGILWGWRMLSSTWSSASSNGNGWISSNTNLPLPESTNGLQRVMVVLTDGENSVGVANLIPNDLYFNGLSGVGTNSLAAPTVLRSSNGQPMTNGTMESSEITALPSSGAGDPTDIDDFQIAACTAIKNSGITIYAITYGSVTTVAQNTMQSCASPNSYYNAPDEATLNTVFGNIATSLGTLRLTQ